MRKTGIVGGALAVIAVIALTMAPAQADHQHGHCDQSTVAYHPSDPDAVNYGKPNSYACEWWNRWIKVCDRHVDGHRVRAWWEGSFTPGQIWATGWAPSQGCLTQGTSYGSGNILRYRVCVEAEGCSAWRKPY